VHGANAPVWKGPEEAALPAVLEAPGYALPGRFEHVLCAVLRECSHTGWSGRALSRSRALWNFLKKKKNSIAGCFLRVKPKPKKEHGDGWMTGGHETMLHRLLGAPQRGRWT